MPIVKEVGKAAGMCAGNLDPKGIRSSDRPTLFLADSSVYIYSQGTDLTLRRLMSYIYIYVEHPFLMFLDHTQRRSIVGRTPLDE